MTDYTLMVSLDGGNTYTPRLTGRLTELYYERLTLPKGSRWYVIDTETNILPTPLWAAAPVEEEN